MTIKLTLTVDDPTGIDTNVLFPGLHAIKPLSATSDNGLGIGLLKYEIVDTAAKSGTYTTLFHGENFQNFVALGTKDIAGNIASAEFGVVDSDNKTTKLAHLDIDLDSNFSPFGGLPMVSAFGLTPDALVTHAGSSGAQLTIIGNLGSDRLTGSNHSDVLDGRIGVDLAIGGYGNDVYYIDDTKDVVLELSGAGTDHVNATASYALSANVESLTLLGSGGIAASGNALANTLTGNGGANTLAGGLGRDTLTGGAGADTFVFRTKADSTVSSGGRDTILDFSRAGHDRIDLHLIDASTKSGGNQAFHFIGSKAFGKQAGELQSKKIAGDTLVSGDVNGDGKADFSVLLDDALALQKGDFFL